MHPVTYLLQSACDVGLGTVAQVATTQFPLELAPARQIKPAVSTKEGQFVSVPPVYDPQPATAMQVAP